MAENGLDLRTWLTVIGVFVLFFGFPAATIAFDARKKRRQEARESTATDPLHARAPAAGVRRPPSRLHPDDAMNPHRRSALDADHAERIRMELP